MHDYRLACRQKTSNTGRSTCRSSSSIRSTLLQHLVPTVDTVRYAFLLTNALSVGKPLLFTGNSGVGKSSSSQTPYVRWSTRARGRACRFRLGSDVCASTQAIESKLEKKKKTLLGPPPGKKMVMFVDDVNMPALETYGASPPVELLGSSSSRQLLRPPEAFLEARHGAIRCRRLRTTIRRAQCADATIVRHHSVWCRNRVRAMKRIFASIVQGHLAGNGQGEITGSAKPSWTRQSTSLLCAGISTDSGQVALHLQSPRRVQGHPGRL